MAYGSNSTYATSNIKSVVEAWTDTKFTDELKQVGDYSARLIKLEELANLGYGNEPVDYCGGCGQCLSYNKTDSVPDWLWDSNYFYWTMSPKDGSSSGVWNVNIDGNVDNSYVGANLSAVRPVINVYKSAIQS